MYVFIFKIASYPPLFLLRGYFGMSVMKGTSISSRDMPPCWKVSV